MNEIFGVLATPQAVFEILVKKPRWLMTTIFCTGILFVIIWLGGCWQDLTRGLRLQSLLGPALISPCIVIIVSFASTAFIYLMHVVLGGAKRTPHEFRTFFSINIHSGVIFLLGEVVNFLLVRSNLLGQYGMPVPNRFPTGLDLLLVGTEEPNPYTAIVLHSTNVFVLWYLLVLAIGIRTITGSGTFRSAAIVAGLWGVAVALVLGMVYAAGGGTTIRIIL